MDATQSSNTGQFILEFINSQLDFIHIWQTDRAKAAKYYNYNGEKIQIGNLDLPSGTIPIYEEGEIRLSRFQLGELNIELVFRGMNITDVESIVSSLSA